MKPTLWDYYLEYVPPQKDMFNNQPDGRQVNYLT